MTESVFTKVFGELGEFIQLVLGTLFLITVFMAFPYLVMRLTDAVDVSDDSSTQSRDSTSMLARIEDWRLQSGPLIRQLEVEIEETQSEVQSRQQVLVALRNRLDSLALTSKQRATLRELDLQPNREPTFWEWIGDRPVWYDILVTAGISGIFYYMGRKRGRASP